MIKRLLTLLLIAVAAMASTVYWSFSVPESAALSDIHQSDSKKSIQCIEPSASEPLDNQGKLNILVWNIYKQNKSNWQVELENFSGDKQLVLLQEASMTAELKTWLNQSHWFGQQVDAFSAFDVTAGVLNLSGSAPSIACAYVEPEPWLRLPKSGIFARYPLSSGKELAVVNIHAVNFTYGTKEYERQVGKLVEGLRQHKGPIIVAGDFNSWSEKRMKALEVSLKSLNVEKVSFTPDYRTEFVTGLVLDHVFYRGLTLEKAEAPQTDASDHNPMLVEFSLQ